MKNFISFVGIRILFEDYIKLPTRNIYTGKVNKNFIKSGQIWEF